MARCSDDGCIFGDMLDGLEGLGGMMRDDMSYNAKYDAVASCNLAAAQWCYRHQAFCPLRGGLFDATGLPCTPWSSVGSMLGLDDDAMWVHGASTLPTKSGPGCTLVDSEARALVLRLTTR